MIRKLMQSIREFKLFSLLSPLFVVLEVVMEVVIPLLMAKLIDEGIDGAGGTFLADEVQYADAVADKATVCMEGIMQSHPEGLAIIACHNDDCAIAAARAAANNPAYAKTIFIGFDGNITAAQSILDGGETMTVAQSGYDQGYQAVKTVVAHLNGEKVDSFVDYQGHRQHHRRGLHGNPQEPDGRQGSCTVNRNTMRCTCSSKCSVSIKQSRFYKERIPMGILKIGVVGCGRIGKLHINNLINSVPGVQVVAAADPMLDKSGAREWLAERKITGVSTDFMDVINNPEVDVVFVCSSTDTHCDVSMAAVQAGKHVFCEKPIDYDIDKIKKLLALVEEKGVKFQVGFNRRFDHNHKAVADAVKDGTIGDPHIVIVSSRDPEPPPASYVAVSGGIFYDMMIHDFDMVRYVTGSEAVEISAVGSCLVNPNLQEESGIPDVDTAVVTMKMANGCIAVINNSRQAVYGYDQRVEAFGSKGMASDANDLLNTTTVLTKDGAHSEKPLWFFLERYNQAFINQVISFVDAINNDTQTVVGAIDGLRPVLMAKAATESCQTGGVFVKVGE